ncbi:hypothetical protein [Marinoscillum sp. MHG1-6]|uniref:hypothetical protein n=1 Tax=Marinoscillum sp. MHG1-6 TaxID=2959627 RepID=UPI0021589C98|nr:hypothetical protein [Marinoscillum sp. MHG1-6]
MRYRFDKKQLHLLSILTFDASLEPVDLDTRLTNNQLELTVERRTFESVKRSKWLFWNRTSYLGKTAELRFIGVSQAQLTNINTEISGNDFIKDISLNETANKVELRTTSGRTLQLTPTDNFKVELEDIRDSNFGKGTSFGKHGFTESEWNELTANEEINAM